MILKESYDMPRQLGDGLLMRWAVPQTQMNWPNSTFDGTAKIRMEIPNGGYGIGPWIS